uniref:SPIN-DOC-like zinc-finger domain-containing protein n=1 Tax=Sinocyclocheilus anshuiensis TaxID=1608454 RepID=A0A671KZD1_9TELE
MLNWHTDKRKFKKVWQDAFLFTEINSRTVCLVCKQSVAVLKEYNIRRHYEAKHSQAFSKYSSEARKQKANELLVKLRSEKSTRLRPSSTQESATRASYQISALIAKSRRAFTTGEFVKECLAVAAEAVCPTQTRMFSQISLSRNNVTRRIEDMAQDIGEQIKAKAGTFSAYSIACDESTDVSDSAQLLVFLRGVNENVKITQELAGIETLSGTTKGEDLFLLLRGYCWMRWMHNMVLRFFDLRDEIRVFQESKNGNIQVPTDKKWLSDLAFLVDVTELLNVLNVQLQGKDQIITQLFDHVKAFKQKLLLLRRRLSAGNLAHFPCLREVGMMKEEVPEFDSRFEYFRHNATDFELFAQPYTISVDTVSDDLQMELFELQCDSELQHKFRSLPLTDFYKCVPANRYPKMCKQAQVMLSLFGSTYLSEQTFSLMNLNKCKLRSKLTDSHLHNILTLSVSQLQPNLEKPLKNKDQLHVSH